MEMELTIRPRSLERPRYLSVLVHGFSGAGKTHFGGTLIKLFQKSVVIVANEEELLTLDQMGLKDYDYIIFRDYDKAWELYLLLRKNEKKWEGIILDGLTDIQQSAKDLSVRSEVGGASEVMRSFLKAERILYRQHWGQILEMIRHFIVPVSQLPVHKLITCLSEVDDDPTDGSLKVYPSLQGSMQQILPAHFSIVGYAFKYPVGIETKYCLLTAPHPRVITKDRLSPGKLYLDPKFEDFLKLLKGEQVPETPEESRIRRSLVIRPPEKEEKK